MKHENKAVTLPYDWHRCSPAHPNEKCRQCLRWDELPGQTWGPWTAVNIKVGGHNKGCSYIPVDRSGKA